MQPLKKSCFIRRSGGIKETDLLDEAEVEHASAKELIAQLESMTAEDPKFAATFKVLGEYVKHHIKEEEGEMFEQLERTRVAVGAVAARNSAAARAADAGTWPRRGRRRGC